MQNYFFDRSSFNKIYIIYLPITTCTSADTAMAPESFINKSFKSCLHCVFSRLLLSFELAIVPFFRHHSSVDGLVQRDTSIGVNSKELMLVPKSL